MRNRFWVWSVALIAVVLPIGLVAVMMFVAFTIGGD
jgi:hypothetical protein